MNYEKIEKRPFIKTAIVSDNYFTAKKSVLIFRKNQTTGLIYSIVIDYDVWRKFKDTENEKLLNGFNNVEIDFIANNILEGEIRAELFLKHVKQHI